MKVYLAAPYAARDTIRSYADELRQIGIKVNSSWLNEQHEINEGTKGAATALTDEQVSQHAQADIREVRESDLLVLFTAATVGMPDAKSGGRHVETGVALALRKPVLVVGEPENVFHRTHDVFVFADWHAALIDLARRFARRDQSIEAAR